MASIDIVATETTEVDQAQRIAENYARFRAIIDGYQEDPRPSLDDVESVARTLGRAVQPGGGQNIYQADLGLLPAIQEGQTFRLRLSPGVLRLRTTDMNRAEKAIERETARELVAAEYAKLRAATLWKLEVERFCREWEAELGRPLTEEDRERVNAGAFTMETPCWKCPVLRRLLGDVAPRREIMEWSRKSREELARTVASLDYSGWDQADGALAMMTLTLPGDWLALAPDGKTWKGFFRKLAGRWRKSVKTVWRGLWKLEFQERGAPHIHMLIRVPVLVHGRRFEDWLSEAWADICGASKEVDGLDEWGEPTSEYLRHLHAGTAIDFSGKDFSDPRRISMYFLGHSAKTTDGKEYQHKVPKEWQRPGKGPGRFWGYCGLKKAEVEVELTKADFDRFRRELRKMKRARDWVTAVKRENGAALREKRSPKSAWAVEAPRQVKRLGGGRMAWRTYNRKRRLEAEAAGEPFVYQKRPAVGALGNDGRPTGGWVLLNDALGAGMKLADWWRA